MHWYQTWQWPLVIWFTASAIAAPLCGMFLRSRKNRFLPYEQLAARLGYIEPGKREAVPEDFQ